MGGDGFGNLNGMRAVITGSSSGIGRAIACELAAGGADVIVHCHRAVAEAESVAASIRRSGRRAEVAKADLSRSNEADRFFEAVWNQWNGIDIWVNNAGVDLLTGDARKLPFEEKLKRLLDVDVAAAIRLARAAGRNMAESGAGAILNIGWDQAERGMEGDSGELFAAAKSAVMSFTRSLALSLAPSVRVNCIAPGWIRTAWGEQASEEWQQRVLRETPLGRWGTPQDVARLARFLCSAEAAFITGQVINVNGGAVR